MTESKPIKSTETEQDPLIVIASNRGPFKFMQNEDGTFTSSRGAGGLVTALAAIAEKMDVLWVAAALSADDKAWAEQQEGQVRNVEGINLRLVVPEDDAYNKYYNVISNPLLWFIQHGLWDIARNPIIDRHIWDAWEEGYKAINQQFAQTIADGVRQTLGDNETRPVIIFPQDYHMYLVPQYLREELGTRAQIQLFLHIPWPGPDGWRTLPREMRETMVKSLLDCDRIGFQTSRDAFNFVQTARFFVEGAHSYGSRDSIVYNERKIYASTYPISIDIEQIEALVQEPSARLQKNQIISQTGDRRLILRVDRVEPSKNIVRGLQAFRALLEDHPEHHGNVSMLNLLVPSRMAVDEYQNYLRDLMAEAGMINAEFSDEFWQPVTVTLGNNYVRALAAMQVYDVLLVNPIADGMNLVAKEGVLVNQRNGVLMLSEHAGAFYELGDYALTVSPFDIHSTAQAMHRALTMSATEREHRSQALKKIVRSHDVREWFENQLQDALAAASQSHANNSSTSDTPEAVISADS